MEITYEYLAELNRKERDNYPYGIGYDNLFNAEHRDIMIRKHGGTSAAFIKIENLEGWK